MRRLLTDLTTALLAILPIVGVLLSSCASDRAPKPVLPNSARIPKSALQGDFYFLKSVVELRSPGAKFAKLLPGSYLKTNQLVRFTVKEKTLDAVSTVTSLQNRRPAERTPIAMSLTVRNVDVLKKQNADGQDTHEEEETESRRPWAEREYVIFDGASDAQDELRVDTLAATTENIQLEAGSIRFDVSRQLSDGTLVRERYHFLAKGPGSGYVAKPYPVDLQQRFGFFKTTQVGYDLYAQPSQADSQEWMNLRDVRKPIRYLVDPSFPDHLKGGVRNALDQWNLALRNSTEKSPLEVAFEPVAERVGDLRYNVVVFDNTPGANHGILGYAPTFADPTSGEIIKGDVILYGGTLAWARLADESWRRAAEAKAPFHKPEPIPDRKTTESQAMNEALRAYRNLPYATERVEAPDLAATVRQHARPLKLLENSQKEFRGEIAERVTRWEAGLPSVDAFANESAIVLEQKIFLPLMAHEIGHTLGLRHNFKGSADHRHHNLAQKTKSSTVMDYGFLASQETPDLGQYDLAAVEMGYGSRRSEQRRLRQENFYFCSDDQIFNPKDGFCLPYDSGTTLTEIIETLFTRYVGTYYFLNLRLDRLYFDDTLDTYLAKVGSLLLPIRQIYDHAAALVNAYENKNFFGIWRLAGARIEADPDSQAEQVVDLAALNSVPPKEGASIEINGESAVVPVLRIDRAKLQAVIEDARAAKRLAVRHLFEIVFKRELGVVDPAAKALSLRPDPDQTDDATPNALWQRGILPDRLMALGLLLTPSPDPLGITKDRSISVTFAEGLPREAKGEFKDRLMQLLSHSVPEKDNGWHPLVPPLPTAVRRTALDWLPQDPGYYSEGSLKKLVALQRLSFDRDPFGPPLFELLDFRFEFPTFNVGGDQSKKRGIEWMVGSVADLLRAKAPAKEKEKETLAALNYLESCIFTSQGAGMKIPGTREMLRASFEPGQPSAAYVHLVTHLYRAEFYRLVNEKIVSTTATEIATEEAKPEFEWDRIGLYQLRAQNEEAAFNAEHLATYIGAEREILEKMYSIFRGGESVTEK